MMNYVKPSLVNLGKSETVIQGACGWGAENWTLDKTGAYWTTQRKQVQIGWLPGMVAVYQCQRIEACSTELPQC